MNITSKSDLRPIRVGLVDDHSLLRRGLANLLAENGFSVVLEADNGQQMVSMIKTHQAPDLMLVDISMPVMDGYQTTEWVKTNLPACKIMALSMNDDEHSVIKMIRAGATGYLLKDAEPGELFQAIKILHEKGFYHSELITARLMRIMQNLSASGGLEIHLNEKEMAFLKYCCTELTYKEIADRIHLSPRTIDGYRDDLFFKLNVKSRIGLALYAIKTALVKL